MEAITAVLEGPLCWLIAYGAVHQSAWRHPAQLVLCSAQVSTGLNRTIVGVGFESHVLLGVQ